MTPVTRPRGPLPARVYWFRRLLVVGVVAGLGVGGTHLLSGTTDETPAPAARPAAAYPTSAAASPTAGPTPSAGPAVAGESTRPADAEPMKPRRTRTPLPEPVGTCADGDVRVVPSLDGDTFAGNDVAITLNISTVSTPACYWEVSPDSVVLRLTSGSDRIWSTQDCPTAIDRQEVVVRQQRPARVSVVWSGQRSDEDCSRTTPWAEPGFYHATAAAFGSDPVDVQFPLLTPPRITITPTPTPEPEDEDASGQQRGSARADNGDADGADEDAPAKQKNRKKQKQRR